MNSSLFRRVGFDCRFRRIFPLYIALITLFHNYGLKTLYFLFPSFHPPLLVFSDMLTKNCGPYLTFVLPAVVPLLVYISLRLLLLKKRTFAYLSVGLIVIPCVAYLLTLLIIPLSLLGAVGYIVVLILTILIPYIRSLEPVKDIKKSNAPPEYELKRVELTHNRWLTLFRLSIWGLITTIVGGFSAVVAFVNSTGVTKVGATEAWGYPLGQLLIVALLVLASLAGISIGVTSYCQSILNDLEKYAEKAQKRIKEN